MAHSNKETAVTVRFDGPQIDRVDRIAAAEREARSVVIRRLVRVGLEIEERRSAEAAQ